MQIPAIHQLSPYPLHWFALTHFTALVHPLPAQKGSFLSTGCLTVLPAKKSHTDVKQYNTKNIGIGIKMVLIMALMFSDFVAVGKFYEAHIPHLQNGNKNNNVKFTELL